MESNSSCFHSQSCLSYDAVVIGSGYGGSVAACRISMAGLKVCLLEKGRKWEAHDFPTNTIEMLSAVRLENRNLGLSFGSRNALYQIYIQDDSLTAIACGLGGGSLVNAGVMIPTPPRAKRNPKWPKEWERDWEACEVSASEMLRLQNVPINFPNAKIMEKIVSEELGSMSQIPVKLSVNFETEDQTYESRNSQQKTDNCQACGNCLSGCPYNAKNSADKTYLVSAIQAGCDIRTECEVQYIVRNPDDTCEALSRRKKRRWRIFLNEFDYIESDFVVLSAGVFGTTKILFQSQLRGLRLSQKLGSGWSCNGNNVAYIARSKAPLNAYGLERKNLSDVPVQERPGPSISSSYISSLGFMIQSAVIPKTFPVMLFKGITTYGWPTGNCFLNKMLYKFKHIFNVNNQDMVLNTMGYDDCNGKLTFKKETNEIWFQPASDPLLPRKIGTFQKLTKKLGGILFKSRYRSTSVHLLGGCGASSDASSGVCNHDGQVFDTKSPTSVHPGLYVCDASLIPCSVGVNPSLTIATAAEHVSKKLVNDTLDFKSKDANFESIKFYEKIDAIYPCMLQKKSVSAVFFEETLQGDVGGLPCIAYLKFKLDSRTFDSRNTEIRNLRAFLVGKVCGYFICKAVEMDRLHVIDGEVDLCQVDSKTPYTQYMNYRLLLAASSGSRYIVEGKKVMNPFFSGFYAWRESTTLHVEFRKFTENESREVLTCLKGKMHVSLFGLLATLISLRGRPKLEFLSVLLQSLFRTYILQVPRGCHKVFSAADLYHFPYPIDTLHEIETEDGSRIKCRQWKCYSGSERHEGGIKPFPVLLINGYATESYCLPTEKTDMIRTLLHKGHETWLLQSRLHPSASSKDASIEDIGRFDVPAAINKIIELHGASTKVHVVAHCVGGLAMHIALMGGHVSCKRIASLSCINSSMFFKLTFWSKVKLWLPLIPISMEILGKDKSLPLFQTYKGSTRQNLLKSIARAIPRYERCTLDECEVFSGIFGNTFWHQNVSHKMHYWLNKVSLPRLPMSAFHHLRKICNAGFIVDSNGKNTYLIHPERMALPTLYLSGGRTLLVTPETSFVANKFMKLHQPRFRHERVVIDGFGHSDLLIGEESSDKVFPHILFHVALAEKENGTPVNIMERNYSKDALFWVQDPYQDSGGGLFSICSLLISVCTLFCFLVLVVVLVNLLPF